MEPLADFRPVFPRSDQFRHFADYLAGLLDPAAKPAHPAAAQALQHFVGHSPWDADALLCVHRRRVADPAAVWVVHDGVFPKKGRHSAGALRQLDRSTGKKLGCQVGVFVTAVGPRGVVPVAARLYLPARWLADNPLAAGRIPEPFRRPRSKVELAADLLAGLPPRAVVAGDGYAELASAADPAAVRAAVGGFERLRRWGYEGRTWAGWHRHVALAMVAAGLSAVG